jgi:hypothetical protein
VTWLNDTLDSKSGAWALLPAVQVEWLSSTVFPAVGIWPTVVPSGVEDTSDHDPVERGGPQGRVGTGP